MHAYLPAIGFGQIKKKSQLQQLLSSVQNFPDQVQKIRLDEESSLVVYTKEVAPDIGLMICGEEDMQGSFQMEYYEPWLIIFHLKASLHILFSTDHKTYVWCNFLCIDDKTALLIQTNFLNLIWEILHAA